MKLSSRLSAAALTIAASLAMGADQSALAQHTERQQTAAVQTVPPLAGSGINSGLTPAFAGYHQVRFRFVDPRGKPVNSKRIAFVRLRSGTGTTRRVTGRDPVWLPAERIVPLEGGLSRKSVEWSVQSVMVDGSNVVNRGQQRFVPGEQRDVSISVLFFQATFSVRDTLFGFPLGSAIRLRFPDGHVRRYPLANRATLQLQALARGQYEVSVDAGGLSFTQPVSLSRDQRVALNVTSYLDVALVGGAIGAILLGLLLVRRPRLRAAIRDRLQHVREQLRRAGQGATGLPIFRIAGVAAILGFGAGIPGRIVFRHRWRRFFPARAQGRVRSASRSGSRWGGPREGSEDQASRAAGRSQPAGPGASPWRGSTGRRRRRGARGHTGAETPADIPAEAPADIPAEAPAGTTPSLGKPPGTGRANCHSRQQQHRTALGGRNNKRRTGRT